MVNQFFKKKSKRLSCRKKYKIEKKVREHNRKLNKDSKASMKKAKKKRKDFTVPNSAPFKEAVLREAEAYRDKKDEEKRVKAEKQKNKRKRDKVNKKMKLENMVEDAEMRNEEFERKQDFVKSQAAKSNIPVENSLKAYYKEFRKVIDAADVILQVLDARDPLGSRCPQVEEAVLSCGPSKKLVLLLNKIDLVPKDNVENWLKYLRNEFPTVAFKASTQSQSEKLSQSKKKFSQLTNANMKTSRCLGADVLLKLLGNYCRNKNLKTSIRVGVVGFPNTGKSSIINSLKRSKACNVGATPGVTRSVQEVQLDSHVRLLDSPGIVMAKGDSAATVLRNAVRVEAVEDPMAPAEVILQRCNKQQMMLLYGLPDYNNVQDFLAQMALRFGRLKKGGVPDVTKAARQLLKDWSQGKITYFTHPPEAFSRSAHVNAEIVAEMSKEFNIDALLAEEQETLKGLKSRGELDIAVSSDGLTAGEEASDVATMGANDLDLDDDDDDDADMDDEQNGEESNMEVPVIGGSRKRKKKRKAGQAEEKEKPDVAMSLKANQTGLTRKKQLKAERKKKKKADKLAGALSKQMSEALSGLGNTDMKSDIYDFKVDFK